jgi:hypothetical protein
MSGEQAYSKPRTVQAQEHRSASLKTVTWTVLHPAHQQTRYSMSSTHQTTHSQVPQLSSRVSRYMVVRWAWSFNSCFRSQRLASMIGRHIATFDWSALLPFGMHLFFVAAHHPVDVFEETGLQTYWQAWTAVVYLLSPLPKDLNKIEFLCCQVLARSVRSRARFTKPIASRLHPAV